MPLSDIATGSCASRPGPTVPSHTALRSATLLGTTILASYLFTVMAGTALAQDKPIVMALPGKNGANGHARIIGSNDRAQPGGDGQVLNFANPPTTLSGRFDRTAILLSSLGGTGGRGDAFGLSDVPGAAGGNGNAVTLTQNGNLLGSGNQTNLTPLIQALSLIHI